MAEKTLLEQATEKLEASRGAAKEENFEPIINYLIIRCRESDSFVEDVMQEHKTWEKCKDYVVKMARELLHNKSGGVEDKKVFEWAEYYFHLDDKAQAEKEKKKEEERKAQAEKDKAAREAAAAKSKKMKEKEAEQKKAAKAAEKKKGKEIEGQMDLFSMFGESDG